MTPNVILSKVAELSALPVLLAAPCLALLNWEGFERIPTEAASSRQATSDLHVDLAAGACAPL